MNEPLLSVRDFSVVYDVDPPVRAVTNVTLDIKRGEIVGLAGESGCGKSTLAYAITRLLKPPAAIVGGKVLFHSREGHDLTRVHQIGERTFPRNDRDPRGAGSNELGMVCWDRCGRHYRAGPGDVGGGMPRQDRRSQGRHIGGARRIRVTPGHLDPSAGGQECQSAHPGAADAHEVDWAGIRG